MFMVWRIGFVLHIWGTACRARTGIGFVWSATGGSPLRFDMGLDSKLGSFRINMGWRDTWYAGIGFVLWKRCGGGAVNWVRFAQLHPDRSGRYPKPAGIGFVSHNGGGKAARCQRHAELGLFCIFQFVVRSA